jgi:nitrogen-specific signal transduction histidine kinase
LPAPRARGGREAKRQLQIQERLAAVGQLAAGIAHDFNNMLQTIVLHCELARRSVGEADLVARRLEPIERQCAHGAALIRQVLDFARKTVTQPQAMDLAPFLVEAARLLERTIPERVVIRVEAEPGDVRVVADAGQLQQLLANLATNASDAMPDGGELEIRLRRVEAGPGDELTAAGLAPGPWVELAVADTGCGMSPTVRERVFEPFFTTKQPGQGTGLGLAQVYGIVQQHGGSIAVTSEEGAGTTFRVWLPLASGVPLAGPPPPPAAGQRGGGELVLVVEDDAAILELARDGLVALGYRVVAAADGAGALEEVQRHREEVALVLSDVVMPGFGGVELARRVREAGLCPRVVLMTGYPLEGEPEGLESLGVVARLSKPFTIAQLADVIHDALRGAPG